MSLRGAKRRGNLSAFDEVHCLRSMKNFPIDCHTQCAHWVRNDNDSRRFTLKFMTENRCLR